MLRSGVTPVVAVVILLGMTVAVSGGAYAWMSQIQGAAQADAREGLATEMEVKDFRCDRGAVEVSLKNSGTTAITTTSASLYIYDSRDTLVTARSVDVSGMAFLDPGGFDILPVHTDYILETGERYRAELRFSDGSHGAEAGCTVEDGSLVDRFYAVDWSNKQWSAFDTDFNEVSPMDQSLGDEPIGCTTDGRYLYTNNRNGKVCRNSIANNSKQCIDMDALTGFSWGGQGITMVGDRLYVGTSGSYGANGNRIYAIDVSDWSSPAIDTWWDASGHGPDEVAGLARHGGYIYQTERDSDSTGVVRWELTGSGATFDRTYAADSNMDNHGATATGGTFYVSNSGEIDRFDGSWTHQEHRSGLDLYTGVCAGYSGDFR